MTHPSSPNKKQSASNPAVPWTAAHVREKGLVLVAFTGQFSLDDVKRQGRETIRLMKEHRVTRVMVDCRNALAEVSLTDIYWLPAIYDQLGAPRFSRVAVVLPVNKYQLEAYHFFELRCRNTFYNIRLFETIDAAEEWLQNKQ
jgi:SpoIIAA-like